MSICLCVCVCMCVCVCVCMCVCVYTHTHTHTHTHTPASRGAEGSMASIFAAALALLLGFRKSTRSESEGSPCGLMATAFCCFWLATVAFALWFARSTALGFRV